MKDTILFIAFMAMGLLATAQVIPDRTLNGIKGSASYVATASYDAVDRFGEIQKGDVTSAEAEYYDSHGFLIERTYVSKYSEGREDQYYENKYNAAGKIEVIDVFNSKETLCERRIFAYTGAKATETEYGGNNGEKQADIVWTKGKRVRYESGGSITCIFDANNRIVKRIGDTSIFKATTLYTYNAKGALSSIKNTYSGGFTTTHTYSHYKYDEKGNWIFRVRSEGGDVTKIEERIIEY